MSARLIIGLGNPGKDYEYTRHNLGFLAVDRLAESRRIKFTHSSLLNSLQAKGEIEGRSCIFLKPLTYMNNSGAAVKKALAHYKIELQDLLIVSDDLNLGFGEIRLRQRGSDGGHNGLHSVIEQIATREFARLRLGIGAPQSKAAMVDYVLTEFDSSEKKKMEPFLEAAVSCMLVWLKDGITEAMTQFNKRKKE